MTRLRVRLSTVVVFGLVGAAIAVGSVSANAAGVGTPVITGLNSPRGITFDSAGSMYVSESGVAGSGEAGIATLGRVRKYPAGSTTPAWSTGFESLYVTEDPTQPPDVLGPAGISAFGTSCFVGVSSTTPWLAPGSSSICTVRMIISLSHDGIAAETGGAVNTTQMGHLFGLDPASGAAKDLANVGDQMFAITGAHQSLGTEFPDSDPFGVLITRDAKGAVRTFVADAAANTVLEINANGTARIIAYIPTETAEPFHDQTPTCVAQGPDGMLYVGTLDLVANFETPGRSSVYRIDPNTTFDPQHPAKPQLWASGLTTITGCTFDRAGNFWATEMFQPSSAGPPGDVVAISFNHPSQITHVGGGSLPLPGGIAQGPDGRMYVTINTAGAPGSGAVVRLG
jgi:glucose/arabinose dehydrogenase